MDPYEEYNEIRSYRFLYSIGRLTDENDDDADIKKAFIKVKNMFIIPKDPD